MISHHRLFLLMMMMIILLCVSVNGLHIQSDSITESNIEGEVEQAASVAAGLGAVDKSTSETDSLLSGEAVSDSDHELFDGMEKKLFGTVHHISDSEEETQHKNLIETEVIADTESDLK